MKINAQSLQSKTAIQTLLDRQAALLIYGQDEGKIKILSDRIKNAFLHGEAGNILCYSYNQILENNALLFDALNTTSLFGDKTVITINQIPSTVDNKIMNIIEQHAPSTDMLLLILGQELKAQSNIRKYFEMHKENGSIACYEDNEYDMMLRIREYFKYKGYNCSYDAISYLAYSLPNNQLSMYRELDKLLLYKGANYNITEEDLYNVISHNKAFDSDSIIENLLLDDKKQLWKHLESMNAQPIQTMLVIRSLLYYLNRVIYILVALRNKEGTIDTIFHKMKPPIFFKKKDIMKKIVKHLSYEKANEYMRKLLQLEIQLKESTSVTNAEVLSFYLGTY